ncbi:hypothetical protein FACS1894101_2360 [Betaproteobacteria bacterium]|nr:hypothetical protein FACS1894101_2360 [Betaproteobacteria bacterium]
MARPNSPARRRNKGGISFNDGGTTSPPHPASAFTLPRAHSRHASGVSRFGIQAVQRLRFIPDDM